MLESPLCGVLLCGLVGLGSVGCGPVEPERSKATGAADEARQARDGAHPAHPPPVWAAPDRRLTRFELAYAVGDVFDVDASRLHGLAPPRSSIGERPDVLVGSMLDTSEFFLQPYRALLQPLAQTIALTLLPRCALAIEPGQCLAELLREPARRLWRRSLTSSELRALFQTPSSAQLADTGAFEADDRVASTTPTGLVGPLARAVYRLMSSPEFYMLELESFAGRTEKPLRRVASRLALTLWSSVPDLELLDAARSGALAEAQEFSHQVTRMLGDARFGRFAEEFSRQWFGLDGKALVRPEVTAEGWVADALYAARAQAELSDWTRMSLERSVSELLSAPVATSTSSAPRGLLTQRALLSALSSPLDSKRVDGGGNENWLGRGLKIQSALLCSSWPLAAAFPLELWAEDELLLAVEKIPRPAEPELLAYRGTSAPCQHCHQQLEGLGAALRMYDGWGQLNHDPELAGPLAGDALALDGPRELAGWVRRTERFEPCVAQKLASYVLSRAVTPRQRREDRALVRGLAEGADHESIRTWLLRLLHHAEFRGAPSGEEGAVVRERLNALPHTLDYLTPLAVSHPEAGSCAEFEPQEFLQEGCGTVACHGTGAHAGVFVGPDLASTQRLLRDAQPRLDGYCKGYDGYINPDQPDEGLLVRKLKGEAGCGAAMPLTGGPRSLNRQDLACLIEWVEAQ